MRSQCRVTLIAIVSLILLFALWHLFKNILKPPPQFSVRFIDILDDPLKTPVAINDKGHLLLSGYQRNPSRGFLWADGEMLEICPECAEIDVRDFNNRDEVAGACVKESTSGHHDRSDWTPFHWSRETDLTVLDGLEERISWVNWLTTVDINDRGRILFSSRQYQTETVNGEEVKVPSLSIVVSVTPSLTFTRFPNGTNCYGINDDGWVLSQDMDGIRISNGVTEYGLDDAFEPGTKVRAVGLNNRGKVLFKVIDTVKRKTGGFVERMLVWSSEAGSKTISPLRSEDSRIVSSNFSFLKMNGRDEILGIQNVRYQLPRWVRPVLEKGLRQTWFPKWFRDRFFEARREIIPTIVRSGETENLNDLIGESLDWELPVLVDFNNRGQIVGVVMKDERKQVVILTPIEHSMEDVR